jgi:signal transduction histidine kinase/DNA-binding response OmpR family regulator
MKEALPDDTYNIIDVNNGIDALRQIKVLRPDLVLLDVTMPGMSGFDVCTEIRRLYGDSEISVVMVTALEDATSIEDSYQHGATDFIGKPINWDTFPYRIQYLIKARNAIVAMQQQQLHLEYMEHISRIITQNKNKNIIMKETMFAMLDIFTADRAILFKPDGTQGQKFIIDCEKTSHAIDTKNESGNTIINTLDTQLLEQVDNSVYPIVSHYNWDLLPPKNNSSLKQQMLSALHLKYTDKWYLIIQQNVDHPTWSVSDEETFYKISLRLTSMLSLHLLTEDLTRNETLLKQTQKIGHLGSWNWNVARKQLTWSNEIYRIYGYPEQTFIPDFNRYFEIEFEEDIDRLQLLTKLQNNLISSYQIDHRIRTPNNIIRWTHEQCIGIYSDTGKLLQINGVVQDITNSRIKKEQDVHNSKMEAIGQITSGVAHDFGNLMTVAKGNLQLLEESMSQSSNTDPEYLELLEDICSAVDDSVELTRQLLSFSRKKPIAPVYVNIKQTLDRFETLFNKTLGVNISLSINVNNNLHDILVDPSQFESALLNIIINARNAMPHGGKVEIIADEIATTRSQQIIRNADNILGDKCVCIAITDDGKGMNDDVLERAIEPFYTTDTNNGTGLGLSMVYGFIKQSGGELVIHSAPNKGTTIYLQFPIAKGLTVENVKIEKTNSLHGVQAHILIVEDRNPVRQFAVRCLSSPKITIAQADNAATAREILASNSIDILFTDIVMPGDMNGHELSAWAKENYPELKILLTTAIEKDIEVKNEKILENEQPFPLLIKPYSKNDLVNNITDLLK